MITSIGRVKVFQNNQHLRNKYAQPTRRNTELLQPNIVLLQNKPTATIILNDVTQCLPFLICKKAKMSILITFIQPCTRCSSLDNKTRKKKGRL